MNQVKATGISNCPKTHQFLNTELARAEWESYSNQKAITKLKVVMAALTSSNTAMIQDCISNAMIS